MVKEHSQVVLKKPLPNLGLEPDDVGVVVNIYANGAAYEVEFLTIDGHTIGLATVDADDLRPASGSAVVHERERYASCTQTSTEM